MASDLRLRSALMRVMRAGGRDWAPSRCSPGMRGRHFDGTSLKPRKLLENAATPTTCPGAVCRGSGALHLPWGSATTVPEAQRSGRVIPVIVRDAVLGSISAIIHYLRGKAKVNLSS